MATSALAYDCVIAGAGPAGLNAALILGRCRRRVLVCDNGEPRNAASPALHGFLTRDGTSPREMLRIAREQLRQYDTVELRHATIVDACRTGGGFEVVLEDRTRAACRKLLIATGIVDRLPPIEGLHELYGRSVFHCAYCDGWEHRDQPLAVYGKAKSGVGQALTLRLWSSDLVLCTNGPGHITPQDMGRLARHGIAVRTERIRRLEGLHGKLQQIVFEEGEPLGRTAMFVHTQQRQHSDLAARLGCTITLRKSVLSGRYESTNVPGLYVAGDASREVQLAIVAAAEGATAAFAINKAMLEEDSQ